MDRRDKFMWLLAAALLLVMLLCITGGPPQRVYTDRDEYLEELVQECIDIHTMEGNSNIAACLELRR